MINNKDTKKQAQNEFTQEEVHLCLTCKEEMKFHMRTHNHYVFKCKKCGGIKYV